MEWQTREGGICFAMIESATVTLTDEALSQLMSLLEKEANSELALRVFVSGGGCSGLQYGMAFDDNVRPGDEVVHQGGVRVLIDDFSAPYIRAPRSTTSTVSWVRGSLFTIRTRSSPAPADTRSTQARTLERPGPAAAAATRRSGRRPGRESEWPAGQNLFTCIS